MSTKPSRKCRSCGEDLAADDVKCPACAAETQHEQAPSNPFELTGDTVALPDPVESTPAAPAPSSAPEPVPESEPDSDPDAAKSDSAYQPEAEPEVKEIDPEPAEGEFGFSPHRGDTVRISMADAVAAWNEDGPEPNEPPPSVPDDVPEIKVPNIKLRMIGMIVAIAGLVALAIYLTS